MGLVKGEGFAVDASLMEANASRYHGKAPDELDWTEKRQRKRAVAEYLAALEAEAVAAGDAQSDNESGGPEGKRQRRYERQPPKAISPSDPQSAWTAKANKRVQFGYGLNYLAQHSKDAVDRSPLVFDRRAALAPVREQGIENLPFRVRQIAPTHCCRPKKGSLESFTYEKIVNTA